MGNRIDVLGIGNAIMDVITPVPDVFLGPNDITKGGMTLIDEATALGLHKAFTKAGKGREVAGGSAANTMVGIAQLGVKTAYFGKVADDAIGARFSSGMKAAGVDFRTRPSKAKGGAATARCLIAVTPDGERSMSTFLGASTAFEKRDLVDKMIMSADVIYLEGYLFDSDAAKKAFVHAAEVAAVITSLRWRLKKWASASLLIQQAQAINTRPACLPDTLWALAGKMPVISARSAPQK